MAWVGAKGEWLRGLGPPHSDPRVDSAHKTHTSQQTCSVCHNKDARRPSARWSSEATPQLLKNFEIASRSI